MDTKSESFSSLDKDEQMNADVQDCEYKYTCALCKHGFDKPKVKYMGSFLLEVVVWIVAIFALGVIGIVIGIIFSLVRLASRKKICPYCKSENFYKNGEF